MGLSGYVRGTRFPRLRARGRQPKTAFVLAGGGVLGAIQVGHLEALSRAGVRPDIVVAASVGALNGAAVAHDPAGSGIELLREIWTQLKTEDIFPGSRLQRVLHFVRKGDHLYPDTGIRNLIARLPAQRFEDLPIPFEVVAANLRTGKERWFGSGALSPALLATTALPSIFPPVMVDGELYVDGGVVNNVPISRAVELGATKIYVLPCGSIRNDGEIRRPIDVLLQAVVHSRSVRVELDMTRFREHAEIVVLPTFDTGVRRFDDPSRSAEIIERARELAEEFLSQTQPTAV